METPGASTRALLLPAASGPRRKRAAGESLATSKQRVLDEEEYIEGLQTVIQRDFFPDVEKLQAQKEYLEAEENGDLERMRQIAIKFGSALGKMSREPPPPYVTPATFETPDVHTGTGMVGNKPRGRGRGLEDGDGEAGEEEEKEPLPSLDVFLSRYTSEDNASFQEIMEVAKEKSRARHTWLYQAEEEFEKRQKDNLALPSAEHQAIESSQAGVETWKYKAKNSLMYYPEGVPDEEQLFKKPRQVVHKNTRFLRDPFSQALSRSQLQQAAALNAQHKQGKVGPDGKELIPQDSPRVGGFGFVATPSPAPDLGAGPQGTAGAEDGQRGCSQEPGQEAGSLEESDGEPGQPHPQRPEPSHVSSPAAPREQDGQQVHRPGPAGQLHPISSTLNPPQDPSWWAPDPHEHAGSWLYSTHPPQPRSSLHHGQSATTPCPAQSLRLLLGPGPGQACGSFVEPAGQLPTQQRTPAFWGPRPGPEMVTVPGATEEMPCLSQTGTKLGPHSLWGASHGLVRTLFYQPPVCFYLAVIKEHLAPSGRLLCPACSARPLGGPRAYSTVSGLQAFLEGSFWVR
ncbi:splicing factor ESS-2 homolog isoform X1 [Acinonyx jubatus]|uniref:Splicing factor ESS-2 homolog isoform X1 n=1 Tax=Acinonyx jubatus TaxID=32536 RepID=A0A6J1YLR6_ACIJB|nr:splicing factor ESS-2 homolog isoform X1 [Acinonyx jubatus]